jgi:multidrug efflux system membrane fusion protein
MKISNPLRTHRRTVYASGALLLIAIVAIAAVQHFRKPAPPPAPPPPIPVTAASAKRQNVPDIVDTIGTVQSIDSVSVQAQVNGPIIKVEFAPGADVKKGQELFLIDPRPYQAALNSQEAQLAHDQGVLAEAQVDLTRYQLLAQQNSIAKQQAEDQVYVVEQDKGTVQLDQANVETAQLNLAYCHVIAPISGRAGALLADLGNLVGPTGGGAQSSNSAANTSNSASGQATSAMVVIAQIKPIYVSFNVPQTYLDQIKHNQAASPLEVDAFSQAGKLLDKGKLTLIDNQVNTSAGTVLLQASFPNTDEQLWPGEFVRTRLTIDTRDNVVTVPTLAVMAGPNGSYVYVINTDMTVKRVPVEVTVNQDGISVIGKGLSGNEKVVVDGQYRLDNGSKVAITATTEPAPTTEVSSE